MKNRSIVKLAAVAFLLQTASLSHSASSIDPDLPEYRTVSDVSGNLSSVGSDTLANVMTLWAEAFKREYPNVNIQVQAASSASRWSDLGLTGSWQCRDIQLFGRNFVSGSYGYFKKKALCKGDNKNTVNEQPGSASVVQSVATSINGIGYSGIGYKTASVRAIPLAKKIGGDFVDATPVNAVSGAYPLSRFLYVYVNKAPNKPLPPLEREFVKLVLSQQGQRVVVKDGYIPKSPDRVPSGLQGPPNPSFKSCCGSSQRL